MVSHVASWLSILFTSAIHGSLNSLQRFVLMSAAFMIIFATLLLFASFTKLTSVWVIFLTMAAFGFAKAPLKYFVAPIYAMTLGYFYITKIYIYFKNCV